MRFYISIFLWPENDRSRCLLFCVILHLVSCLVIGFASRRSPGLFVNFFMWVAGWRHHRVFLLLQNPQVSVHYYLCLNVRYVFPSILDKFILSRFSYLSPPRQNVHVPALTLQFFRLSCTGGAYCLIRFYILKTQVPPKCWHPHTRSHSITTQKNTTWMFS
jgi:hypothetical protein